MLCGTEEFSRAKVGVGAKPGGEFLGPGEAGSCTVWPRCGWSMAAPERQTVQRGGRFQVPISAATGGRSGRSEQVIGRGQWASGRPASGTGADGQQAQVHSASLPPRQSRPAPAGFDYRRKT